MLIWNSDYQIDYKMSKLPKIPYFFNIFDVFSVGIAFIATVIFLFIGDYVATGIVLLSFIFCNLLLWKRWRKWSKLKKDHKILTKIKKVCDTPVLRQEGETVIFHWVQAEIPDDFLPIGSNEQKTN